jgi:hypothetical protein
MGGIERRGVPGSDFAMPASNLTSPGWKFPPMSQAFKKGASPNPAQPILFKKTLLLQIIPAVIFSMGLE